MKRAQGEEGDWSGRWAKGYSVGETLLVAYALLEAGVPADDPVIQKAAAYCRPRLPKTNRTYELALGVLFLDRLGDSQDEPLLRSLTLHLIAGQSPSGGWKYICPRVKPEDEETLLRLLAEVNKLVKKGEKPSAKWRKEANIPRTLQTLTVLHFSGKVPSVEPTLIPRKKLSEEEEWLYYNSGRTDNSNTQFAMLALWVARRRKIPVRPTIDLVALRFRNTQSAWGIWGYLYVSGGRDTILLDTRRKFDDEWKSMTCVGLLAMGIAFNLERTSTAETTPAKVPADRHVPSTEQGKSLPHVPAGSKIKDTRFLKGLVYLYRCVGIPTGRMEARVPLPLEGYYFLWSLERVAMLYNLPTLADKEWYRWGAEILVTNQKPNGGFPISGHGGSSEILATAFALLFLKHSHPMKDLTPELPFTPNQLNDSIARLAPKGDKGPDRATVSPSQRPSLDRSITSPGQSRNPDR